MGTQELLLYNIFLLSHAFTFSHFQCRYLVLIFIQLFNSWYNNNTDKAEAEEDLVALESQRENAVKSGNVNLVPEIDAKIEEQKSIIDSSDKFNQEVKTARKLKRIFNLFD